MGINVSLARFDATVARYLAHRRALGRGSEQDEWVLCRLRRFVVDRGAADLNRQLFDDWCATFGHRHPNTRYTYQSVVYHFCRYRRRSELDCFLPDPAHFARRVPHALPSLIEPQQIARALQLAASVQLARRSPLRPAVMRMALVLLYTAGLRLGELQRLTLGDIDLPTGLLHIRESKFHKSRWVPLSPSALMELRRYLQVRQRHGADLRPGAPLLCHRPRGWHAYSVNGLGEGVHVLFEAAGLRNSAGRCPRVHDVRHAFAVQALLRWYQQGGDVQAKLPALALYMGHVSIVSTAYYLRWMPAVLARAGERFERAFGHLLQVGTS